MKKRSLDVIEEIIIHINDSPYINHDAKVMNGPGWHQDRFNTASSMAPYGQYKYLGYHRVIKFDGAVQKGRLLEYYGQHCSGRNYNSVGICLQGTKDTVITQEQFKALKEEIMDLKEKIPSIRSVSQHSDYDPANKPHCAGLTKSQTDALNVLVM